MITFITPEGKKILFSRVTETMPKETKSIKPHPYGIEVGTFIKMCQTTSSKTVKSFMMNDFSRMGSTTVDQILKDSEVNPRYKPTEITREQAEKIIKVIQKTRIMNPPLDCLSPIGDEALRKSLRTELDSEFVTTVSRAPSVYRGNPFLIEAAIAYGGSLSADKSADIIRFANKVPLQYNGSACAITEVIKKVDWRRYGLSQPGGSGVPIGPIMILVHMASTWIPFTSESKSAIAQYTPIMKEMRLAVQDCARELNNYLRKKGQAQRQKIKINTFVKYGRELINPLAVITEMKEEDVKSLIDGMLKQKYGDVLDVKQN
jgi:DNA topoisomerase-6 subunit B